MTHPFRSILALSILAIVVVACGTTVGAPPSEVPVPSQPATPVVVPSEEPAVEPSEPAEAPADEERDVDGVITVYPGAFSGPGGSIQDALDHGSDAADMPSLVNGVVFRDTDGRIYLATSVSDVSGPTFDGPMLEVLEYGSDDALWDMEIAELLGLEEANGIVFKQDAQILGILEVR